MVSVFVVVALVFLGHWTRDDGAEILLIRVEEYEPGTAHRSEAACLERIKRAQASSVGALDRVALICRRVNIEAAP